jgi:hypothetical protein
MLFISKWDISIERKFIHEFAFGYQIALQQWLLFQKLTSDAKINSAQEEQLSKLSYILYMRSSFIY